MPAPAETEALEAPSVESPSTAAGGAAGGPYRRLRQAVSSALSEPLARTSSGLMASTLLSAVLGVGFWALAARTLSARDVGRDSALVAAVLAISAIGQLNLNNSFPRFLPRMRDRLGQRVMIGYAVAAAASLLGGALFVVLAPLASSKFAFAEHDRAVWLLFPLSVSAWTIFSLQDSVIIALGRAAWLPIENGLFSLGRVLILPLVVLLSSGHAVFVAYVVPMFVAVPVMNWFIARRGIPAAAARQATSRGVVEAVGWRPLLAFMGQDLAGTALAQLAMMAIPLLVVVLIGTASNAYFYVPFTLITTFDALFLAVAASLTTEGARTPERARELTRRALRWLMLAQVPIAALIALAAPLVLTPYGHAYVTHGTLVLRLLAAASCFRAVVFLYGGVARLRGAGRQLLNLQVAVAVTLVGLVYVLARADGLVGVGLAWLLGWALLAAAVALPLARFARAPHVWGADEQAGSATADSPRSSVELDRTVPA